MRVASVVPMLLMAVSAVAQNPSQLTSLNLDGFGPFTSNNIVTGTIQGNPVGNGTYSIGLFQGALLPNGQPGGNCAFVSGQGSITAKNGDALYFTVGGTACNIGAAPVIADTLTYVLTDGTGKFAGAVGTGSLSIALYTNALSNYVHFGGNIFK
jgi:hypothetical protein